MIYDIILVLIFAFFVIWGIRRGIAATLVSLGLNFVSYFISASLGKWISGIIYTSIIQPTINQSIEASIYNFSNNAFDDALNTLPDWLTGVLNISGADITELFQGPIDGIKDTAVQSVEEIVRPIVIGILSFFITILLFFFIVFLLRKLLMKPILSIFKLPVLKQINSIFGGVAGAVEAFLLVSMIAYLLSLLVPYISTDVAILKESTINSSFIFKYFYSGNIFSMLTSWIH